MAVTTGQTLIIGVAGGSGSGKTYFVEALYKILGDQACCVVLQDDFYVDQSDRFDFDGGSVNFDHPDSIDFQCLARCLGNLKNNMKADVPTYDFKTHSRSRQTKTVAAKSIVLVDGILIFHDPAVRCLFDELIYFDTPEELRFQRRLKRDVEVRGRTPDGVRNQFYKQVKPMHDLFVEPSKVFATTQVNDVDDFDQVLRRYQERLLELVDSLSMSGSSLPRAKS